MKPRRTVHSEKVYELIGGNEDNSLWTYLVADVNDHPVTASVWVPTDDERARIAAGENIRLLVWGTAMLPVALDLTDEALGKAQTQ